MAIYLIGHGNWHLRDGFARVPAGTSITFYTQNSKTLFFAEAKKIVSGNPGFGANNVDKYDEYKAVPNMTLSSFGRDQEFEQAASGRTDDFKLVFASEPIKLSAIFLDPAYAGKELIWVGCRAVKLKQVRKVTKNESGEVVNVKLVGPLIGVNVREDPNQLVSPYFSADPSKFKVDKYDFNGFMPRNWSAANTSAKPK